jgi:hypothetical protein
MNTLSSSEASFQFVVVIQAHHPELLEHPGGRPLLKPQVRRAAGANVRLIQGIPLAACSQYEEDAVHCLTIRHSGPATAEAVRVLVPGQQWLNLLPQFVRYQISILRCVHP